MRDILVHFGEHHYEIAEEIERTGELSDECRENIVSIAKKFLQERK